MDFWDEYEHKDSKLIYILENLISEEVEKLIESEFAGCNCIDECVSEICACLKRSGAQYDFSDRKQINRYKLKLINQERPAFECNRNCKCSSFCGNRLVQFGPRKHLNLVSTEKGLGLETQEAIRRGYYICEYAGEVINETESQKRFQLYREMQLEHNYIFCINETFGSRNTKTFIDPTFYGNIGRYINHSCEPNSILVPIRINNDIPKLCIFAQTDISSESEITFDYGTSGRSEKLCLCFSKNCRKFLPFDTY